MSFCAIAAAARPHRTAAKAVGRSVRRRGRKPPASRPPRGIPPQTGPRRFPPRVPQATRRGVHGRTLREDMRLRITMPRPPRSQMQCGGGRREKMRTTLRHRPAGCGSRKESPVEQPEAADPSVRSAALPALHGRGAESRSGTSSPIVGTITSATPDCAARRAFSSGSSHGWRASAYFEWWTVNTRAAPSSRTARSR